jgi:hypothetical protein
MPSTTTPAPVRISTTFPKYRVACDARTGKPTANAAAAENQLDAIEKLDACRELHTIEVLAGDEWLPRHVAIARRIMAAPVTHPPAIVDLPDGPLKVVSGGWTVEAGIRADAAGKPGSAEWKAALGPHDREVILTSDGRSANREEWCTEHDAPMEKWVRYERWTPEGRRSHGYVCPTLTCRQLVQTG